MSHVKVKLGWRKIVEKVFRPYVVQEGGGTRISTAKGSHKWLRPSRSFSIFRSFPTPPTENDGSSSFMSPMPEEDRPCSMEDPCLISSPELDNWEDESVDTESVNLSFINCREIIDIFPEPPIVRNSQSDSSQRPGWYRPPIPAAFLLHAPCQDSAGCWNVHCPKPKPAEPLRTPPSPYGPSFRDLSQTAAPVSGRHILKKAPGRSPTPFPNTIHYGHGRNWNTRATISGGSTSTPDLLASAATSFESLMLIEDPHKSISSLRSSSRVSIVRCRSQNQPSRVNSSSYTRTPRTRLSPGMSLEDMRSITPAQGAFFKPELPSPPLPPSSYRTVAHVPGLERRLRHSRSTFTLAGGFSCINENYVSPGTPHF